MVPSARPSVRLIPAFVLQGVAVLMASRNRFIVNLHLIGAACSATLAAVTAGILIAVCPPSTSSLLANPIIWGSLTVFAVGLVLDQIVVKLLLSRVLKP